MDSNRENNANQQYVQQTVKEKLVYIQKNEQEPILFPYLQKLFVKKGFQNVQITHGNKEYGKDLVFCDIDKFNDKIWYGVIVKNKKASQNDFNLGGEIRNQIELAYKVPYKDNLSNEHHINHLLIIINASISDNATIIIGKMVENHLKVNIKLWDQQKIEEEIEKHTKLEFLYGDNSITNNLEYNKSWMKIYEQFRLSSKDKKIQLKELQNTKSLKINNRFLKSTTIQEQILAELSRIDLLNNDIIQLITFAINDIGINIEYYPEIRNKIITYKNISKEDIESIFARGNTLSMTKDSIDNKLTNDTYIYENILRFLYRFEFEEAKKLLNTWTPKGTWIQKKAGLLYLFQEENRTEILSTYINKENNIKEKYYATQLLNLISDNWNANSTKIYENLNLDGLSDFSSYYIDKISHNKKMIKPYGSFTNSINSNDRIKHKNSLKLLHFLIESGTFIQYQYCIFISPEDWYNTFKNLYIYYPYPCLFYSIQCNNINIARRIGQDFAYSKELREELINIQNKLLTIYQTTNLPSYIEDGILRIAKELFIAISPNIWENNFIEIWKNNINSIYQEKHTNNPLWDFLQTGISYISNKQFINETIILCLNNHTININISITILNKLKKNYISNKTKIKINNFSREIKTPKDYILLFILKDFITEKCKIELSSKINKIDKNIEIPIESLYSLSYFSKLSTTSHNYIKERIISHSQLWNNGITENGGYSSPIYISLFTLENNLNWKNQEIKHIYQVLVKKFMELRTKFNNHIKTDILIDYSYYLFDMTLFIEHNYSILKKEKNFKITRLSISEEYINNRGYINIEDALSSDNQNIVRRGLFELTQTVSKENIDKHLHKIELLIYKIIFQRKEDLTNSIYHLCYIICTHFNKELIEKIYDNLIIILKRYNNKTCKELNLDLPICYSSFIKISDILKKYGFKSEHIDYWQKIKSEKWFTTLLD